MATRITVRALRINPSEIMRRVKSGESFEVTVRGEKVATIQPYSARTPYQQLEEEGAIMHGRHDIDWAAWEPLPADRSHTSPRRAGHSFRRARPYRAPPCRLWRSQ